jgi:ribonucleoside-diphosphate reductase alpha chain
VKDVDFEVEFPKSWSSTAVEIASLKYFRHGETSLRQLVQRVAQTVRQAGEWQGYFDAAQGVIFEEELTAVLIQQIGSFNSPVWFNCGLFPAYKIAGKSECFAWDFEKKKVAAFSTAFIRPQLSACFIQNIEDDLISIFDLVKSEAKLFKYGSGTGTNFSKLRAKGESIAGGPGTPGVLSYLEIFDRAAQVMRSGGTTRRAAKMVVLDADHPEIEEFIQWKVTEERKARVLMAGGFGQGFDSEAFKTVSGQNSNNSIRFTDEFMNKVINDEPWMLTFRTTKQKAKEISARKLFDLACKAAWECADPGVQFHDTIQRHHLCPRSGEIRASNPCSEFLFLDDSACNLASLNLVKFLKPDGSFDWNAFEKGCRLFLIAQEILVDYASYPTEKIAEMSHRYRPLGLGFANLGGLLMRLAIPYDSEAAAEWTSAVTASMHFTALRASAELAEEKGAFDGFEHDRISALSALHQHLSALENLKLKSEFAAPLKNIRMQAIETFEKIGRTGLRNAQVTLIAPTGTIGLFMDCDTLGIEPDFSLVKIKNLVGGQTLRLINTSVGPALKKLGYSPKQIQEVEAHLVAKGTLIGAPHLKEADLPIFDTAVPNPDRIERLISWQGHLRIMAAAQPFLSGGISKTVNLPKNATVETVREVYMSAWKQGLKCVAVYRDGSKALQPLCLDC